MTVSVCMGTYNGEKYIEEQLISILNQELRAEEVIICDDNSTDRTVDIIRKFISNNKLEGSWKLYCNDRNKGYPGNFYHAMSLCTMDVVFLSDQDDIWDSKKLKKMESVFEQNREINAASCKFGLIDADGNHLHTAMRPSHSRETGKLRNISIDDVFYKCEWPGMVLAYRNAWYRRWSACLPGENLMIPHDFLVCARAAEERSFMQMDEELAYHRRHDRNTGKEEHSIRKLLNKSRKLNEIETYLEILEGFEREHILQTDSGRESLMKKRQSMKDRCTAIQSGSIFKVLNNARKYRGSVRAATVLCDVLIAKK